MTAVRSAESSRSRSGIVVGRGHSILDPGRDQRLAIGLLGLRCQPVAEDDQGYFGETQATSVATVLSLAALGCLAGATAIYGRLAGSDMLPITDPLLMYIAEISATLIGLFLVGVFFYVGSELRRSHVARNEADMYMRAGTRIVLILYAIPLSVSLTLVSLNPIWARLPFAALCAFSRSFEE